jgi:hypothetical protein
MRKHLPYPSHHSELHPHLPLLRIIEDKVGVTIGGHPRQGRPSPCQEVQHGANEVVARPSDRKQDDVLLDRVPGRPEGLTSSTTPAPELRVASVVSGMAHRRLETVGDATVGATSPALVSSLDETGMGSINGIGPTATASAAVISGSTDAPGVCWAASAPSWVVSWAAWGRDEALADVLAPRFTTLVVVKDGLWARRLLLKQDKMSGKKPRA